MKCKATEGTFHWEMCPRSPFLMPLAGSCSFEISEEGSRRFLADSKGRMLS